MPSESACLEQVSTALPTNARNTLGASNTMRCRELPGASRPQGRLASAWTGRKTLQYKASRAILRQRRKREILNRIDFAGEWQLLSGFRERPFSPVVGNSPVRPCWGPSRRSGVEPRLPLGVFGLTYKKAGDRFSEELERAVCPSVPKPLSVHF